MNLSLSIDDRTFKEASRIADAMGKSLTELIREQLERLVTKSDAASDIEELERLSTPPRGDSRGARFNRDEIYERS